jgi:xylulokinase
MSLTLGIDSSTQSCSALVIDTDADRVVAEASVNYGQSLPQYGAPSGFIPDGPDGEVHADPRMWLDALEILLEDLGTRCDLGKIDAISGAGQQHGSVYLNDRWVPMLGALDPARPLSEQLVGCLSRPTSPIWMDGSTAAECAEISDAAGGATEVCARTGSVVTERFTGPQIRRFSKLAPEAYTATSRIHLVSSFLCSVLCGRDAPVDTGDGAGMNLLNLGTADWDDVLLEATAPDLRGKLPQPVAGDTVAGELDPFFAARFGFRAGIPVAVFTGDNPSSLIGMGAGRPGKVVVSLGTSDTFFAAMPGIASDPDGCGHVFGNPRGGWMSLQCFINGSLAREAVKDRFGFDWDAFTSSFAATPPGNDGKRMLPFFRPEISPKVDLAEPRLAGGADFEAWKEPQAAVRACVEGQFFNMRAQTRWMNLAPETLYLTGGAAANDAIAQVAANIFEARVERLAVSGSVALGAALRAAHCGCGASLDALAERFCRPESGGAIEPVSTWQPETDLRAWIDLLESAR